MTGRLRSALTIGALCVPIGTSIARAEPLPVVSVKVKAVPIVGFPGTGNRLGAGAAIRLEYTITGAGEAAGTPLLGLSLGFPKGVVVHPSGFPTCPSATLAPGGAGPSACPPGSSAGPTGRASITLGPNLPAEEATVQTFYSPEGGLESVLSAQTRQPVEFLFTWHYRSPATEGEHELVAELPLERPLRGGPFVSLDSLTLILGTAGRRVIPVHNIAFYYLRLPKTCPRGGYLFRSSVTLATEEGHPFDLLEQNLRPPCPVRHIGTVPPPPPAPCTSDRQFVIHLALIGGRRPRRVSVTLDGQPLHVQRGPAPSVVVDLRGLPKGTYAVQIRITTAAGRRISVVRSYRTCVGTGTA